MPRHFRMQQISSLTPLLSMTQLFNMSDMKVLKLANFDTLPIGTGRH